MIIDIMMTIIIMMMMDIVITEMEMSGIITILMARNIGQVIDHIDTIDPDVIDTMMDI